MAIYIFSRNAICYALTRAADPDDTNPAVKAFGYRDGIDFAALESGETDNLDPVTAAALIEVTGQTLAAEGVRSAAEPVASTPPADPVPADPKISNIADFRARRRPQPVLMGDEPA